MKNYLSILLLIFFVISCSQPPLEEPLTPNELTFPSNKVGAHFVNYLEHVEYKHQVFEALEVDLIYSSDRNIFYVAHGLADTVGNILFEDWLHQIQNPEKNWFWLDLKNLNQKNAEPIAQLLVNLLNEYGIIHQTICENKDVKALAVLKRDGLAVCYWIKQDKFLRKVLGKKIWGRIIKKNVAYLKPHAISASYLMYPLVTSVFPDANFLFWNTPINDLNENMEMTRKLCRLPNVKVVIVDYPEPIDYE